MQQSDEALARQLQAEENAAAAAAARQPAAAAHLRGGGGDSRRIVTLVEDGVLKALGYEDPLAQAMALNVMPAERLRGAAREAAALSLAMGEQPPLAEEDALALELLAWFKQDFFSWVNAAPCDACGETATVGAGAGAPTPAEAAGGAGRVELYRCPRCGMTTRFPRYNSAVKLLETRRGRCGEWANCFTLCCRAMGLDVRLAVDLEDHVWTEQWSQSAAPGGCGEGSGSGGGGRWIHLDPCEAAADRPLLYEAGWGKALSYVVAVGRHGAADVTRRYTRSYDAVQTRRHLVEEGWLDDYLRHVSARLRAQLSPGQRRNLERRDAADREHMLRLGSAPLSAEEAALPARQTGDAAWLAARGEDGSSGAAGRAAAAAAGSAAVPPPPPPGTRYRLAKDEGLQAEHPRRLCGGAVRASGENSPGETAARAFDGSPATKWLDFGGRNPGGAWLEYRLLAGAPAVVLGAYALTSGDDSPERDPRHVVLQAWSEDASDWVVLDEQQHLHFPHRQHRLLRRLDRSSSTPVAARRFRLRIVSVADPSAANSVQLACLDLFKAPDQQAQAAAAEGSGQQGASSVATSEQQLAAMRLTVDGQGETPQQQQHQREEQPPPAAAPQPQHAAAAAAPAVGTGPDNPWAALFAGPPL